MPASAGDPRLLVSYRFTLGLYEIVGHILSAFYEEDKPSQPEKVLGDTVPRKRSLFNAPSMVKRIETGDVRDLVKHEASLDAWETSLPSYLRFHVRVTHSGHTIQPRARDNSIGAIFERQAVFLRARFLHSRILLFRPLLLHRLTRSKLPDSGEICTTSTRSILLQSLLTQSSNMCTSAARELIFLVSDILEAGIDNLPETWYTVFYMYTCGMILLVGHLCTAVDGVPSRGKSNDEKQNRLAWIKCLEVLRTYQESSRTARKCLRLLELTGTRFWPTPIQHDGPQPLPASDQSPSSAFLNNASAMTSHGLNSDISCQQQDQQNPLQQSGPFNSMMDSATIADNNIEFRNLQGQNNHQLWTDKSIDTAWTDESIDMAWLNALPFEISFEDTIYGTFNSVEISDDLSLH